MARSTLSYQKWPLIVTVVGLGLSGWLGWATTGTYGGLLSFLFVGAILAALEIALSFDNAIVNANKLEEMTPVWQRRFLTWGILIAVFGMRIVFPLAIVAIFAWINPFAAMHLALSDPDEYSRIIGEAHGPISAFGGTFLMMVALKFFIDEDKSVDWIVGLETRLRAPLESQYFRYHTKLKNRMKRQLGEYHLHTIERQQGQTIEYWQSLSSSLCRRMIGSNCC